MIPAGVTKLIWAIAPNAIVREAMLGDFNEEFATREREEGIAAARHWCWGEALRSLSGTLRHSFPSGTALVTSVLPALLWGYLVLAVSMIFVVLLTLPVIGLLIRVMSWSNVSILLSLLAAIPLGILAGYETARIGSKAPLWSAIILGVLLLAASIVAGFGSTSTSLFLLLRVVQWALLAPSLFTGALLQQAQYRRLALSQ